MADNDKSNMAIELATSAQADSDDSKQELNEADLEKQLADQLADLDSIDKRIEQIGDPKALGDVVMHTIWQQFENQIGIQAGEDFVEENHGLSFDISNEAHIQTTENFANGKIANHNTEINYQQRYNDWQSNFQKDATGKVVTHTTRTGKTEATLVKGARAPFDKDRPAGNKVRHTDMDHTVSAGEIIRNPAANAHLTKDEQIRFANSTENLNEMDSGWNRSKGDKSMSDWLDNPNSNGQKPAEIFNISKTDEERLRGKDKRARKALKKEIEKGKAVSIETGRKSQIAEGFRITKSAARAIAINLLAELLKKITQKFVIWLKSAERNWGLLWDEIKRAVVDFVKDVKTLIINVMDTAMTVITDSILGPIAEVLMKIKMILVQGWETLKAAIDYVRDPQHKSESTGDLIIEVGKIVIAGLAAVGGIGLSGAITTALSGIPVLAVEIPMLGSLASIIGIFMGSIIAGIVGALIIERLNRLLAKRQKQSLVGKWIDKANDVLATQNEIIEDKKQQLQATQSDVITSIEERHRNAHKVVADSVKYIMDNNGADNNKDFKKIYKGLDRLLEEE